MVGAELDRLAQMKKDGVMTVQLTYNNAQPVGRRLARAGATRGLSKLGRATIERIEAEKLLLDLSHGGARTMAEAAAYREAAAGDQPYRRARADRSSAQHRRRDDQGGGRQGRRRRRLFHAVPDADSHPKARGPDRSCRACRQRRGRGSCRHRHRQRRAAARRSTRRPRSKLERMAAASGSSRHRRAGRSGRRLSAGRGLQQRRPLPAASPRTCRSAAGARRGSKS